MRTRLRVEHAFLQAPAAAGAGAGGDFPMTFYEPEAGKSRLTTGALAALLHLGILGLLVWFAALAPEALDTIIPVRLLKDPSPKAPAPARRALAERRNLNFAPAMQAVQPQIVNPRAIAEAAAAAHAEALQMDAMNSSAAPTAVDHSLTVVERVSAVGAVGAYRASEVDVENLAGPAVRGPVRAVGPVHASVGPRKVEGSSGTSLGTGSLAIEGSSSVREGVISARDIVGSPNSGVLVSVDTAIGEGNLRGPGGEGTGLLGESASQECLERSEVQQYFTAIQQSVFSRWTDTQGITDVSVKLRFSVDVAGSASNIQLIEGDNALGAGAIDAMKSASPFPPLQERTRCLAGRKLIATFNTGSLAG